MDKSSESKNVIAAFVAAQAQFKAPNKDNKNGFIGNDYSTLSAVLSAVRPALKDNGLAIYQETTEESGCLVVATTVFHVSGEFISTTGRYPLIPLPKKKGSEEISGTVISPQAYGSASTYARRYALMAALGLAHWAEEDDGHRASEIKDAPQELSKKAQNIAKDIHDSIELSELQAVGESLKKWREIGISRDDAVALDRLRKDKKLSIEQAIK